MAAEMVKWCATETPPWGAFVSHAKGAAKNQSFLRGTAPHTFRRDAPDPVLLSETGSQTSASGATDSLQKATPAKITKALSLRRYVLESHDQNPKAKFADKNMTLSVMLRELPRKGTRFSRK